MTPTRAENLSDLLLSKFPFRRRCPLDSKTSRKRSRERKQVNRYSVLRIDSQLFGKFRQIRDLELEIFRLEGSEITRSILQDSWKKLHHSRKLPVNVNEALRFILQSERDGGYSDPTAR